MLADPPSFQIDFAYDAPAAGIPVGDGYAARPPGQALLGIILHSTNGPRGSTFDAEARYLRNSRLVKAHYLIGREGHITRLLDPGAWAAYHAGKSAYGPLTDLNRCTAGIECHHSIGDAWPPVQLAACAWLCRTLRADHPSIRWVAAHRDVAIPVGRKSDPDDLSSEFIAGFIAAL